MECPVAEAGIDYFPNGPASPQTTGKSTKWGGLRAVCNECFFLLFHLFRDSKREAHQKRKGKGLIFVQWTQGQRA